MARMAAAPQQTQLSMDFGAGTLCAGHSRGITG